MNDFDRVFATDIDEEIGFETMFNPDSDLVDLVAGDSILEAADVDESEDGGEPDPETLPNECYQRTTSEMDDMMNDDDENDVEEDCHKYCNKECNQPSVSNNDPGSVVAPPVNIPVTTSDLDITMSGEPVSSKPHYEDLPKVIDEEPEDKVQSVQTPSYKVETTYELDELFENYIEEGAKFSFLPRFKQHPELKDLYSSVADAEELLNMNGEVTKNTAIKICNIILRIWDICTNLVSILTLPLCVLIFPIPIHLIYRLCEYAYKSGEYILAERAAKKSISTLNKLKNETKDPKVKQKCQQEIEKISGKIKKLNESEIDTPETTTDLDRVMLNDGEASVEDIKDLQNNGNEDGVTDDSYKSEFAVGEGTTTAEFDNVINITNDEDISPDSEGALDDGDDIDSLAESFTFI